MAEQYKMEFPDYPASDIPADLPAVWVDKSWHNDACPSWLAWGHDAADWADVFIDYADPMMRECGPDTDRFCINLTGPSGEGDCLFACEEWPEFREMAERYRLGWTFAMILAREMAPAHWAEMRMENRHHADDGICASHDYRDSNMDMEAAYNEVFGSIWTADGELSEIGAARWNTAWDFAKKHYLTAGEDGALFDQWRATRRAGFDDDQEPIAAGFVYAPGFISRFGEQFHVVISNSDQLFPSLYQAELWLWEDYARQEGGFTRPKMTAEEAAAILQPAARGLFAAMRRAVGVHDIGEALRPVQAALGLLDDGSASILFSGFNWRVASRAERTAHLSAYVRYEIEQEFEPTS